ncbi:synaptogenesis protein syg-2-like isoform X2 [Haliotis cracherodii]|uniref:synaptogenesis protein syg-2-like isoform X2 n=1 Tax=Haliotis cracherodii TaxID=6455 RepID=UPI0039E89AE4
MTVDVQYRASLSMFTANSISGSVTVNESNQVNFRCQLDSAGNPRSVIRLLNGTKELTRADNSLTAEYRLESADCRQRGNYSCTATNNIGAPVSQRVELLVNCSPRVAESVPTQLKYATGLGGNVNVSVSVLAYPLPTFTWSRTTSTSQDLTGSSSPVSDISVTARLHLTNLQQQDFGDYSLTVDNGVRGSVAYTVRIVTEGPPDVPTQFRVLDNATTSSVWLSWLPGFNGGHPQTFLIECRQFATRTWTVYNSHEDTGEMLIVEVTGLKQGDIYIFRLHAKNDYEDSNRYVFVETMTAGDPQKLETPCTSTGVIAGSTVGGMLLTLLIVGIVLIVLFRQGYRIGNILKGTATRNSTRNAETVEMDNRGYSSLDQISGPAQYLHLETEKQQYSQLKIYENTKADAAVDTSTYEGMTETPPVTYESISASTYQNTVEHS